MGVDLYYAIFCIFGMITAGFIFYHAFMHRNQICILLICIHLAIAYGDHVYNKREGSILYSYMSGLTNAKKETK